MDFFEKLNEGLREEERIFKFKTAAVSGGFLTVELLVDAAVYDKLLTPALRDKVKKVTDSLVPPDIKSKVVFVKTTTDELSVKRELFQYLNANCALLYNSFASAEISIVQAPMLVTVTITAEKFLCDLAKETGLIEGLKNALEHYFIEDFNICFVEIPNKETDTYAEYSAAPQAFLRVVDIEISTNYQGKISQRPRYIIDVRGRKNENIAVCGTVKNLRARRIDKLEKTVYNFYLDDTTASMPIAVWSKKKSTWDEVLADGKQFVFQGAIEFSSFSHAFVLTAAAFASCKIDFTTIAVPEAKIEKSASKETDEDEEEVPPPSEQQGIFNIDE